MLTNTGEEKGDRRGGGRRAQTSGGTTAREKRKTERVGEERINTKKRKRTTRTTEVNIKRVTHTNIGWIDRAHKVI